MNSPARPPIEVQVDNLVNQGVDRDRLEAQLEEIIAIPERAPPVRGALAYGRGHRSMSHSRERPRTGQYNIDPNERAFYGEGEYGPYRRPQETLGNADYSTPAFRPYRAARYPSPGRDRLDLRNDVRDTNVGGNLP